MPAPLAVPLAVTLAIALTAPAAHAQDWDHEDIVYGDEDPDRQWLNIMLADGADPAPVLMFAHGNGGSAANMQAASIDLIAEAGYTLVSWESLISVSEVEEVEIGMADAQLVFDWIRDNAATYNMDPDRIVVGGRSRGSVISWMLAHSNDPSIAGAYFYNALPDRVWLFTDDLDFVAAVNEGSPQTYFAYGPAPNDGDSHNPVNIYPVVDRYEELGVGSVLTDNLTANGLDSMHFFPDFAAWIEGGEQPADGGGFPPGEDGGGRRCSAAGPTVGSSWLALVLLAVRRRR